MRRGSAAVSLAGAATVVDVSRGARAKSLPDHNSVIAAAMADSWSRPNLSGLPPSPRQNRLVHRVVAEGGLILLRSQLATSMTEPALLRLSHQPGLAACLQRFCGRDRGAARKHDGDVVLG